MIKCVHCGLDSKKHHPADLSCPAGTSRRGALVFHATNRFTLPKAPPDTRLVARAAHLYSLAIVANTVPTKLEHVDDVSLRILRRSVDRARLDIMRQGLKPATLRTPLDCLEAMRGRTWHR